MRSPERIAQGQLLQAGQCFNQAMGECATGLLNLAQPGKHGVPISQIQDILKKVQLKGIEAMNELDKAVREIKENIKDDQPRS